MTDDTTDTGTGTRAGSVAALERASGRSWPEWLAHFEAHGVTAHRTGAGNAGAGNAGADSAPAHAEIARIARLAMPEGLQNPDWWAQGAAIAYEQHAGLRVPGQSSTGDFRVSASRTMALDRDAAVEAWAAGPGALAEHDGHAASRPRRSRTDKRTFFRFDLDGAGRVEVAATPNAKDPAKSTLAVNHDGLPDAEAVEAWRAYWKALLAGL